MTNIFGTNKRIRLGIWGLGRGQNFIKACNALNIDVVAGCDLNPAMRDSFRKNCPDAFITADEDEFLARDDMDAVLIATWFCAHAAHAVKALRAGKHVLSEVTSFFTPAEGAALVEAVEASGKVYNLAENYPFMKCNLFIEKLWRDGLFGELAYAEYDYVHDCRSLSYSYITGEPVVPGNTAHQWRSWLNFHYYCTHSLGPVMCITGTRPVKVWAPPSVKRLPGYLNGSEMGSMEPCLIQMDNGGVVRNLTGSGTGDSHARRIWGTRAAVDMSTGEPLVTVGQSGHGRKLQLKAEWPMFGDLADSTGHDGGDFWELYYFARQILTGEKAPWDIYRACDVTLPGIMAVKSQLSDGAMIEVPDFRNKTVRDTFREDHFMQYHLDPAKLFPENQNCAVTMNFTSCMTKFFDFDSIMGTVLVNSAFDGMKLYHLLSSDTDRLKVISDVRKLLKELPALAENYREARRIADAYPDTLGGRAIRECLDAGWMEKILDVERTSEELISWLTTAPEGASAVPEQLKMHMTEERMRQIQIPLVPEGFRLRTYCGNDDGEKYIELMRRAGFDCWNQELLEKTLEKALPDGIFFIEEIATGRLAATAMANRASIAGQSSGGEYGWVGVDPDFRGKRLSAIVGAAVIERFRREGYRDLYLLTDDFRIPAIRLYLSEGWEPLLLNEDLRARWQKLLLLPELAAYRTMLEKYLTR